MSVASRPARVTVYSCLFALSFAACGGGTLSDTDEFNSEVPEYQGNAPGNNETVNPLEPAAPADPGSPSQTPPPGSSTPEQPPANIPLNPDGSPSGQNGGGNQPPTDQPPTGQPPTDQPPTGQPPTDQPPTDQPPTDQPPVQQPQPASDGRPTRGTANLFTDVLGMPVADVDAKIETIINRIFGIGTNEPNIPVRNSGYRLYYELPQDPSQAFIFAADPGAAGEVRSEGQSYGMMLAVQMNMQSQFDKLWNFANTQMRFRTNDGWNNYFRWQGSVNASANNITVNFAQNGPAPDGEEYFAAALYLANRRWGSTGVNYLQEAQSLSSAMLNNQASGGTARTPVIDRTNNQVVFFPSGTAATFSDPSYHLPAFYEIFASDGPQADSARWRQIAQTSRQYFVRSADPSTGLHPDYAAFGGGAQQGQGVHNQFQFDAWRVVMNMAVDYAWTGPNATLKTQIEKYHSFFANHATDAANNVQASLFFVNGNLGTDSSSGQNTGGGSSTALTATLASGALASTAANARMYIDNAWNVGQQQGMYRYYQELVYALGMLASAGWYGYQWSAQ